MKLDRNINPDGRGKYALILLRKLHDNARSQEAHENVRAAIDMLIGAGVLDFGDTEDSEFFVIRLKDKNAYPALSAYADAAAENGDPEFADQVERLAERAYAHPRQKLPD